MSSADEFEKTAPKPDSYYLGTKCWECSHARGEHDEKECRGGEDTLCRCDSFVEPEEDEQYERERARDKRQRVNDEAAEWEAIEARDRFSREGDVETPLGEQIEGE